jgi:hypothetical protein
LADSGAALLESLPRGHQGFPLLVRKEIMREQLYTTQFQAGLGMVEETRILLDLWQPGMTAPELFQQALDSGDFPNICRHWTQEISPTSPLAVSAIWFRSVLLRDT